MVIRWVFKLFHQTTKNIENVFVQMFKYTFFFAANAPGIWSTVHANDGRPALPPGSGTLPSPGW